MLLLQLVQGGTGRADVGRCSVVRFLRTVEVRLMADLRQRINFGRLVGIDEIATVH